MAKVEMVLRQVEAIMCDGEWLENESFTLDIVHFSREELTPRRILSCLRKFGYLTNGSKGKLKVVDHCDMFEIAIKSTGQPIFYLVPYFLIRDNFRVSVHRKVFTS